MTSSENIENPIKMFLDFAGEHIIIALILIAVFLYVAWGLLQVLVVLLINLFWVGVILLLIYGVYRLLAGNKKNMWNGKKITVKNQGKKYETENTGAEITSNKPIDVNKGDYSNNIQNAENRPIISKKYNSPSEIPKESFRDVAGMEELKKKLRMLIIDLREKPDLAKDFRIKPGGGILLYGPPGCGKTFIAKAIAGEAKINFREVSIPEIRSMWIGETSKNFSTIFNRAREISPCILFFDEIDALGGSREDMTSHYGREETNTFLTELSKAIDSNDQLLVIGATNAPWLVDHALRRSGRFGKPIYVPPPDASARVKLFQLHLKGRKSQKNIDYKILSKYTSGFSAADIKDVCEEAARMAFDEAKNGMVDRRITMDDLRSTISKHGSTIGEWYNNAKKHIKEFSAFCILFE